MFYVDQERPVHPGGDRKGFLRHAALGAQSTDLPSHGLASAKRNGSRLVRHSLNVGTWLHEVCSHVPTLGGVDEDLRHFAGRGLGLVRRGAEPSWNPVRRVQGDR